jgi:hypothetical protein
VVFWRKSGDPLALVVSFTLMYMGALLFTDSDDALLRHFAVVRAPVAILNQAGWLAFLLLALTFPDATIVPRQRPLQLALVALAASVLPFAGQAARTVSVATVMTLLVAGLGLATQVYRYFRVSGPIQRQQTKWIVAGLFAVVTVMAIWVSTGVIFPPGRSSVERIHALFVIRMVIVALISALPVSIAFSVLRYHLWDIDFIIRRTLVYSALTAVLAGVYFAGVVLLQTLLRGLTGQTSQLAVVGSTLAIAALFAPLRGRIQQFIDRRFYRRKYDATRTLAAFAAAARDETDLDALAGRLVSVVDETVQPAHISLWLRGRQEPTA